MPNGHIHSLATLTLAGLDGYWAWHAHGQIIGLAMAGGTLAGLLLSPDLDVNTGSISDSWVRHSFGLILGGIWYTLWRPYAYLIPHRSPLSHTPVISTVFRVGYLAMVAYLVILAFHESRMAINLPSLPFWWPWSFLGLTIADSAHWALDHTIHSRRKPWQHTQAERTVQGLTRK